MLKWTASALTDQGAKRADNQDNYWLSQDKQILVVADGMGGALGGSTASRLTVSAIEGFWDSLKPDLSDSDSICQWLSEAINKANETVFGFSEENPAVKGMGTTAVVAVHGKDSRIYVGHVGDSRAYLVRNGVPIVLTQDHSLVMELYHGGHITEEQMKESPFKHFITRCVGHKNKVDIDHNPYDLKAGDWILLCTDGLMAVLTDEEIANIIWSAKDPEEACQILVEQTLAGGAPDNVTVIVARYSED